MSLLVLKVTLNGHSRCDLSVQLMVVVQLLVMRDSHLRSPYQIHHQVLDSAKAEFAVLVELVHEGKLAHAIWTVPVVSLLMVADHHRHH